MTSRIMIAAPKSGSGKTSVTIALLGALKKLNKKTVSFKCGPDYIDPLFHKTVLGIPSFNLDTFFTDENKTNELFIRHSEGFDIAVIEGVMGLYDGLGGIRKEGSSYHLAKVTDTPIVLVVDAKGMGRSVVSLIKGFMADDNEDFIKGVILNRTSKTFYETIAPVIETETGLDVLGFMSERKDVNISSRHLGLTTPNDLKDINETIDNLCDEFTGNVSIEKIISIASRSDLSETINPDAAKRALQTSTEDSAVCLKETCSAERSAAICHIAVARDDAFCFIYEDNLDLLREYGADIFFFSPLNDERIPNGADAVYLPGGYPELYLEKLSSNKSMLSSIKEAYERSMPFFAECGGFMYLHKSIEDKEKNKFNMVGIIDAECTFTGKSVRFGYIELKEKRANFLPEGEKIKGHEFHYYDSTQNGESVKAVKPVSGKEYDCVIENENSWMGFAHLYFPSNPAFARNFISKAAAYHRGAQPEISDGLE